MNVFSNFFFFKFSGASQPKFISNYFLLGFPSFKGPSVLPDTVIPARSRSSHASPFVSP